VIQTLTNDVDGTANGGAEKLKKAFHPDVNLYTISYYSLRDPEKTYKECQRSRKIEQHWQDNSY
jgi:hypothetical protein